MANQEFLLKYQSLPAAVQEALEKIVDELFQKYTLQRVQKQVAKPKPLVRKAGTMKGLIAYMAEDFDAPLEDFKDYV